MSDISAEEALSKAKEIAARLTGETSEGTAAVAPARTERKRKRWGSAPATSNVASLVTESLPGLAEAKLKQEQQAAKPSGPSTKRVWVPTTRERPETHFFSFLKDRLEELSARINASEFQGDEQNKMELGGRGATTQAVFGMPLEPMHVTIQGSDAFIAAAAPRLEELLAEGEKAEREGPPPEESPSNALEDSSNKDKYSSMALTLTRPYYQGSNSSKPKSEYRPATVAQLISGNPDFLGDMGNGVGGEGNKELLEEIIRIPNGIVGFIIGRGGETITSMQARTGCKVQIQKEHELQPGQTERIITLQAVKQESITECREIIESMVRDRVRAVGGNSSHRNSAQGGLGIGGRTDDSDAKVHQAMTEGHKLVTVEVPDADVGLIIGKGGSTIKQIQESTGSSVQIPHSATPENPSVRCISITCPTMEGAEAAKTQIQNIIQNKISNNSHKVNNGGNMPYAVSIQVEIPTNDVGLCIGRQGCVIRQLQSKSNTRIDIPPHPPPGRTVRVLTVSGPTQEACEMARSFIERIVSEQSSACVMSGSPYAGSNHHGGPGLGYQNQYRNQSRDHYGAAEGQNAAQSNDPAWQAYYAAQALANKQQKQQQQQQANTAVAGTAPDAYYEQFHRYAYYYGEEAARQYYGSWSPPMGTPNPYGTNPDGVTVPPASNTATGSHSAVSQAPTPAPSSSQQVRDSSVRKVSNLPAWMTKNQ